MFFDWDKGMIRAGKVLGIVEILCQGDAVRLSVEQSHQGSAMDGRLYG